MKETWRKNCNCESTSTHGKIVDVYTETSYRLVDIDYFCDWRIFCDKCGEPWKLIEEEE